MYVCIDEDMHRGGYLLDERRKGRIVRSYIQSGLILGKASRAKASSLLT